ncbi:DinB family protein [Kordia zhangzhouensis]|uniref:DinB family protein n=1 Tax=Kordia zhangzhouensis TaxID=1620405 RepID=UPI0006299050|nr:DinB family protein [Kordia zhangzhouensis]
MKTTITELYKRELDRLYTEIDSYIEEDSLWKLADHISNSGGNLCLHLIGNLHHFIGKYIGNTDYVRHREAEFDTKNTPKATLLTEIKTVQKTVVSSLTQLQEEDLAKNYPIEKNGEIVTIGHMLLHLFWHLSYHIGQINYHRRLLDQ